MERMFLKKRITAIIFILLIFTFFFQDLKQAYTPIKQALKSENVVKTSLNDSINIIESTINDNTFEKYKFIEYYGYFQKLMCKNEESNFEVVKDNNGFLHYTFFAQQANPVYNLVKRTVAFKNGLKNKNTKLSYLMPPDKFIKGYTKLPYGIPYSYANETADSFLNLLKQNNVDTIDLRKNLNKSGIQPDQLFYKTDHHWKTETAFYEFGQVVNTFNTKYGLKLDPNGFYTNKQNYNFITYKDSYVGSMGRKTGITYSGVDDFTLIYPKFKTSYSFYSKTGTQESKIQGRFEDTLLTVSPLRTQKGTYALESDKYSSYLFGNQGIVHVVNNDNPNGPKILFIKDSVTVPLAAFLSTVCSDVYLVDPRYYQGNIPDYVNSLNLNYVFISFYPQDLTEDFFKFYEGK